MKNFSISNIKKPTPIWAKNLFRFSLFLSALASMYIPSVTYLSEDIKQNIVGAIPAFNFIIYNFSKMFGIPEQEIKP